MSRGYGKSYRKGNVHTNFQFDSLFKENTNRPSASRSAGTVGKWGITSFTSIRTANGLSRGEEALTTTTTTPTKPVRQDKRETVTKPAPAPAAYAFDPEPKSETSANNVAKPKKFFKSRNVNSAGDGAKSDTSSYGEKADYTYSAPSKKSKPSSTSEPKASAKPKKFFSSKNAKADPESVPAAAAAAKRDEAKPPIVLRICRGKSQLLSDSDESESTPTPSSAPVSATLTSPRAARDSQRSPGHTRVTRSTRRSLQQDPSSSPATAESPTDTFSALFMSPKKGSDLSPVYIPAEKYELERKAMYDNLLRPNSPTDSASTSVTNGGAAPECRSPEPEPEPEGFPPQAGESPGSAGAQESVPEPMDTSAANDEEDHTQMQAAEALLQEAVVDFEATATKMLEPAKTDIQQDWSSEEESEEEGAPADKEFAEEEEEQQKSFPAAARRQEEAPDKPAPENPPSVKLVISKKKGSIFKSRSMVSDGSKKRRYEYKHKWCDDRDKEPQKGASEAADDKKAPSQGSVYDDMFDFEGDPLTRVQHEDDDDEADAVTSVKCTKRDKDVRCR